MVVGDKTSRIGIMKGKGGKGLGKGQRGAPQASRVFQNLCHQLGSDNSISGWDGREVLPLAQFGSPDAELRQGFKGEQFIWEMSPRLTSRESGEVTQGITKPGAIVGMLKVTCLRVLPPEGWVPGHLSNQSCRSVVDGCSGTPGGV